MMNRSSSFSGFPLNNNDTNRYSTNSILKNSNSNLSHKSNSNSNIKKSVSINEINEVVDYTIKDYEKYDNREYDDDPRNYLVKKNSLNTILQNSELPNSRQSSYLELTKTPSNESLRSNQNPPKIREDIQIILPETRIQKQVDPISKFYKIPFHNPRVPIVFHSKIHPREKIILNIHLLNTNDCKVMWKLVECNLGTVNYDPDNLQLHEFQYSFRELFSSFSFNKTSGVVEPFEQEKILLTFSPPTPGEYEQQWYLQCKRTKILLELKGYCKDRIERRRRKEPVNVEYYYSSDDSDSSDEEEDIYSDLPYIPINIYKYDDFDEPVKNDKENLLRNNIKLSTTTLSTENSSYFKDYEKPEEVEENNNRISRDPDIEFNNRDIDIGDINDSNTSDDDDNDNYHKRKGKEKKSNKMKNKDKKKKNKKKEKEKEVDIDDNYNDDNHKIMPKNDSQILNDLDDYKPIQDNPLSSTDMINQNSKDNSSEGEVEILNRSGEGFNFDDPNNTNNPNNNPNNNKFNSYNNYPYLNYPNNRYPNNNYPNYNYPNNNYPNNNFPNNNFPNNNFPNNKFPSNNYPSYPNNNYPNGNKNFFNSNFPRNGNYPNNNYPNNIYNPFINNPNNPYSSSYENPNKDPNNKDQNYFNPYFPLVNNINNSGEMPSYYKNSYNSNDNNNENNNNNNNNNQDLYNDKNKSNNNIFNNANTNDKETTSSKDKIVNIGNISDSKNNINNSVTDIANKNKTINDSKNNVNDSNISINDRNGVDFKTKEKEKKAKGIIKNNNKHDIKKQKEQERNQKDKKKDHSHKSKNKNGDKIKKEKTKITKEYKETKIKHKKKHKNRRRKYSSSSSSSSFESAHSRSNDDSESTHLSYSSSYSSSSYNNRNIPSKSPSLSFSSYSSDKILDERSINPYNNDDNISNDSSEIYSIEYSNERTESYDITSYTENEDISNRHYRNNIPNNSSSNTIISNSREIESRNSPIVNNFMDGKNNYYDSKRNDPNKNDNAIISPKKVDIPIKSVQIESKPLHRMIKNVSMNSLNCQAALSSFSSDINSNDSLKNVKMKSNPKSSNRENHYDESNQNNNNDNNDNNTHIISHDKNYNDDHNKESPEQQYTNFYPNNNSKQDLYNLVKDPYYHQFIHINRSDYNSDNNSFYSFKNNTLSIGNRSVSIDEIHKKLQDKKENELKKNKSSSNICDEIKKTISTVYNEDPEEESNKFQKANEMKTKYNNEDINKENILNNVRSKIKIYNNNKINDNRGDYNTYRRSNLSGYTNSIHNGHSIHNTSNKRNEHHHHSRYGNKIDDNRSNYEKYRRYPASRTYSISSNKYSQSDYTSNSSKDVLLKTQNEGQIQQFITSKLNQLLVKDDKRKVKYTNTNNNFIDI